MNYMGSKKRIAKELSEFFNSVRKPGQLFVEPFCGSCAVSKRMEGPALCNDIHHPLIEMYKGLQNGWRPEKRIYTEEDYKFIKNSDDVDVRLKAFIGFHLAFGANYFGTYARSKKGGSKNLNEAVRNNRMFKSLERLIKDLGHIQFISVDYRQLVIPRGSIVYCDPPYFNSYGYSSGDFNTFEFWRWVKNLSRYSQVYVSEYVAPKDFKCVLSFNLTETIKADSVKNKIECLFTYKSKTTK